MIVLVFVILFIFVLILIFIGNIDKRWFIFVFKNEL
jgi:hypothetical protein